VTFLEHDERMCAPRARLDVWAIRWAIRQLRFEGATIAGLARQLGTTWNTVWFHIKPCLQATSDDPTRFAGVRVLGAMRGVWHHQDRRRRGPHALTGIVDRSRGGSSHGPLEWTWSQAGLAPCMRTGWPSVANSFAPVSFAPVSRSRRWIPSRDSKNASVRPSRQMRRISVSTSPTFTGQVREVFHQATPTQGRHLAAHLIQRLPACPIPEIARLGRTLRKWKDALDAYFDTDGASNGSTEAINGHYRAGQTHRQRLPQPHQLPTPNAPHRRRSRCLHPHPTLKSP